jgi:hypothetical protein
LVVNLLDGDGIAVEGRPMAFVAALASCNEPDQWRTRLWMLVRLACRDMGKVTGDLFTSIGLAGKERASRRVVNKVAGNVWKPNFLGVRGSTEIYSRFVLAHFSIRLFLRAY